MENHIKKFRKERSLTQQALAEILGVSRQTVISIESGKYDPSLSLAFKISEAFDEKVEKVFINNK